MAAEICTFNCNGLRDDLKRKSIFHWLNHENYSIIFLQETHSINADEGKWKKEWGGDIYFGHGASDSRGVAILIKKNFPIHISDVYESTDRILLLHYTDIKYV